MRRIVIVGGGIAGLSAAYYMSKDVQEPVAISLLEASKYWGGKLVTERQDDFVIEGGPDTFIVTKPWALDLCRQLGIDGRLKGTNPEHKNTYILHTGRLHPLPGGLTMMIPTEFTPMIRTGLLSWPAKARMGADFLIPPAARNGDESLGAFVTRRLGRQAYERLIEPLMSGIYAGDGDLLSLQATFPYLRDLELEYGGLVKGALALHRKRIRSQLRKNGGTVPGTTPGSRSIFLTPQRGLAEIVEALLANLQTSGVRLRLNTGVTNIERMAKGYRLRLRDGERIEADGLILATPAYVTSDLLKGFAPELAAELKAIEYATTATVTLAYRESDLGRPLDGYGYVIPRSEGRQALACTWTSTKFPHRAPRGYALLRVFIGRAGQEDDLAWDEDSLLEIARQELRSTLNILAEPVLKRVFIWDKAMPQYNLGHPTRLERIRAGMEPFPSLALAGNGYSGIGIPDCIHSGELAAMRLLKIRTG